MMQTLVWRRWNTTHQPLVTNYTPPGWFECDVFGITKAGYGVEWEVKLSRSDFFADAKKKGHHIWIRHPIRQGIKNRWLPAETKHQRLADGDNEGPSRFFFVVPEGLISADELPEWAGLCILDAEREWVRIERPAPRLHNYKVEQSTIVNMYRSCYWRYWTQRIKNFNRSVDRGRNIR